MKTEGIESIGIRLKRLRLEAKLSASEVAKILQVAPSTYREWEYGRAIRGEPYEHLANVFGVSIEELMIGKKKRNSRASELIRQIEELVGNLKREIRL